MRVMDRRSAPERMPVVAEPAAASQVDIVVLGARQPPPARGAPIPLGVDECSLVGQAMAWRGNREAEPTISPSTAGVDELDMSQVVEDREDRRLALFKPMLAEVRHVLI
jgi:hypothetical protein